MTGSIFKSHTYRCPDCQVSWQEDVAMWNEETKKWEQRPDDIPMHLKGCRFAPTPRRTRK